MGGQKTHGKEMHMYDMPEGNVLKPTGAHVRMYVGNGRSEHTHTHTQRICIRTHLCTYN